MPLYKGKGKLEDFINLSEYVSLLQERVPYGDLVYDTKNATSVALEKVQNGLYYKARALMPSEALKAQQKLVQAPDEDLEVNQATLLTTDIENAYKLSQAIGMVLSRNTRDYYRVTQRAQNYVRLDA